MQRKENHPEWRKSPAGAPGPGEPIRPTDLLNPKNQLTKAQAEAVAERLNGSVEPESTINKREQSSHPVTKIELPGDPATMEDQELACYCADAFVKFATAIEYVIALKKRFEAKSPVWLREVGFLGCSTWDQFCETHFHRTRRAVNKAIAAFREQERKALPESTETETEFVQPPNVEPLLAHVQAVHELRQWMDAEIPIAAKHICIKPCGHGGGAGMGQNLKPGELIPSFDMELHNLTDDDVRQIVRYIKGNSCPHCGQLLEPDDSCDCQDAAPAPPESLPIIRTAQDIADVVLGHKKHLRLVKFTTNQAGDIAYFAIQFSYVEKPYDKEGLITELVPLLQPYGWVRNVNTMGLFRKPNGWEPWMAETIRPASERKPEPSRGKK